MKNFVLVEHAFFVKLAYHIIIGYWAKINLSQKTLNYNL